MIRRGNRERCALTCAISKSPLGMKARPKHHDNELNKNEDGDQEELATFGVFFEALLKLVLEVWTFVECHKICKVQPGVAAVHQRLCKNCVNFPRLDENC